MRRYDELKELERKGKLKDPEMIKELERLQKDKMVQEGHKVIAETEAKKNLSVQNEATDTLAASKLGTAKSNSVNEQRTESRNIFSSAASISIDFSKASSQTVPAVEKEPELPKQTQQVSIAMKTTGVDF